ncbi:hypothetical protein D3C85_1909640 [compost metagenome]
MYSEVIYRSLRGLALLQKKKMLGKQLVIKGEGMIIIDRFPFAHTEMRMVLIVVILRYKGDFI